MSYKYVLDLQIMLDVEHAKCSICLNIWHDVVTGAPCLHNFWSDLNTFES